MLIDAIVLGAGSGSRYRRGASHKQELPKQLELICEKPVLIWSIESLLKDCPIRNVVVVAPALLLDKTREIVDTYLPKISPKIFVIVGGGRRQDSALRGLEAIEQYSPPPERVLIHDACRPYLGKTLQRGLQFCESRPDCLGWVPGLSVTETLKQVENEKIKKTIDRNHLFRMQTPQIFHFPTILKTAKKLASREQVFTDDASLLEFEGIPVGVFEGDYRNIKLTYDYELELLNRYLQTERPMSCESETATISTESFPL